MNYEGDLMKQRQFIRALCAVALGVTLLFAFVSAPQTATRAQQAGSKDTLTPTFWQRDPDANFEDEGRMHCAPTSVADGLIYLTRAFGMKGLVPGTDHDNQIKLIEALAEEFGTDPS